jgi:hypothetical protein
VTTGHAARRIRRRGPAGAGALAALAAVACAPPPVQPPATPEALARIAAAVRHDVFDRPVALAELLADRAVLYFFRSRCEYCAADLAAAPALATAPGSPPLVLISRERPARLRAAMGPGPRPGLVVISDEDGRIMGAALPTRFVPRVIAVEGGRIRLDMTGAGGGGLRRAVATLARAKR